MDNIIVKFKDSKANFNIDTNKNTMIFAFNGAGKTRLLQSIKESQIVPISLKKYNIGETNLQKIDKTPIGIDKSAMLLVLYEIVELHHEAYHLHDYKKVYMLFKDRNVSLMIEKNETIFPQLREMMKISSRDFLEFYSLKMLPYIKNKIDAKDFDDELLVDIVWLWLRDFRQRVVQKSDEFEKDYLVFRFDELMIQFRALTRNVSRRINEKTTPFEHKRSVYLLETNRIVLKGEGDFFEEEIYNVTGINNLKEKLFTDEFEKLNISEEREKIFTKIEIINEELKFFDADITISFKENEFRFEKKSSFLSSENFSSGERSLLIMMFYTTFLVDSYILIDEVDLSLTLEWQYQIVKTLSNLNNNNIFLLTSHSPLVYRKMSELDFEVINYL